MDRKRKVAEPEEEKQVCNAAAAWNKNHPISFVRIFLGLIF